MLHCLSLPILYLFSFFFFMNRPKSSLNIKILQLLKPAAVAARPSAVAAVFLLDLVYRLGQTWSATRRRSARPCPGWRSGRSRRFQDRHQGRPRARSAERRRARTEDGVGAEVGTRTAAGGQAPVAVG